MPERGPRPFMGEAPEQEKKVEEEKAIEVAPYSELLEQVNEQMVKVVGALEDERKIAAEIRGMGGKVTKETAQRIMDLEAQKNGLVGAYQELIKNAAEAAEGDYELLVAKPENFDALMTDPEVMEVTDDMIIEAQTADDLAKLEKDLVDETEKVKGEMESLKAGIDKANGDPGPKMPDFGDPELRKAWIGVVDARRKELQDRIPMIEEMERDGILPKGSGEALRKRVAELDSEVITALYEAEQQAAAAEKAAKQAEERAELNRLYAAMAEAQLGELGNYVRAVSEKLAEVRVNLGFAEKMEGKKAA